MRRFSILLALFFSFSMSSAQKEDSSTESSTEKGNAKDVHYFPFNRGKAFPHFTQVGVGIGPLVGTFDLAVQYHFRFFTFRNEFKTSLKGEAWDRIDATLTGKLFRVRDRFHVSLGVGVYHSTQYPLDHPLDLLFERGRSGLNFYIILERRIRDRFSLSLENSFGPRFGIDEPAGPYHLSLKAHLRLFKEPEPPVIERAEPEPERFR